MRDFQDARNELGKATIVSLLEERNLFDTRYISSVATPETPAPHPKSPIRAPSAEYSAACGL
jgi:hypothetical protein